MRARTAFLIVPLLLVRALSACSSPPDAAPKSAPTSESNDTSEPGDAATAPSTVETPLSPERTDAGSTAATPTAPPDTMEVYAGGERLPVATFTAETANDAFAMHAVETAPEGLPDRDAGARLEAFHVVLPAATTPGTFKCDATHGLKYMDDTTRVKQKTGMVAHVYVPAPPMPCQIVVRSFGAIGQRVEGTFSATLVDQVSTTADVRGTFSFARK